MSTNVAELAAAVSVEGVPQSAASLDTFGRKVDEVANKQQGAAARSAEHDAALRKVGTGATIAGGLLVAGFGLAVAATANFDKAMSGVGAVANANATQMGKLRQAAIDAGQATAFSASQAATAEAELAKAGLSVGQILGGALTGALSLAAAGQLDLKDAATITAQALNVFKLSGDQASHVADVLAAGANKSAADVGQLGDALRQGGLMARQTGLSLEETVGTLALFADNALIGSDAGTSLKTMLQRLTPQSKEASDEMQRLGIHAYDASGKFVGMEKFAGNLRSSLKNLSDEERNTSLNIIFGSDAVRAASLIYDAGASGIRNYTKAVDDHGAAARMAAAQMDNLSGDVEQLKGSLETALITGGSAATGMLRGLTQAATEAVNAFSSLPPELQGAALGLAGITGAGLLATGVAIKLHESFGKLKTLAEDFTFLSNAAARFGPELAGAAATLGTFGLMFAGVAAASYGIVELFDLGAESMSRWQREGNALAKGAVADANQTSNAYKSLSQEHAAYGAILDLATQRSKQYGNALNARTADTEALEAELVGLMPVEVEARNQILANRQAYDQTGKALAELKPKFQELKQQQQEAADKAEVTAAKYGIVIPQSFSTAEKGADGFGKALAASTTQFGTAAAQAAVNAGIVGDSLTGLAKHAEQMDKATAGSIESFTSIVGKFGGAAQVGEQEILNFVTSTTAQTQQWADDMKALSAAGVDGGLLDQLRQAGPKAEPLVQQLLQMVSDGAIGAVNESYAKVRDIAGQLNEALDSAAIVTQIKIMESTTVAKAAYADLESGGTSHLMALANSSDENIRRAAYEWLGRIADMQAGVNGLHGKEPPVKVEVDILGALASLATAQQAIDNMHDKRVDITVVQSLIYNNGPEGGIPGVWAPPGAHGLVGLARGGAGMIVGPNRPVLIGEGLSREAVVPFDNFGDAVATIRNTGAANFFASASAAAGGGYPSAPMLQAPDWLTGNTPTSGLAQIPQLTADAVKAQLDRTLTDFWSTENEQQRTVDAAFYSALTDADPSSAIDKAIKAALDDFWTTQDLAQRTTDAAIYSQLSTFRQAANAGSDVLQQMIDETLRDFWSTTDEAKRAADAATYKMLSDLLEQQKALAPDPTQLAPGKSTDTNAELADAIGKLINAVKENTRTVGKGDPKIQAAVDWLSRIYGQDVMNGDQLTRLASAGSSAFANGRTV